MVATLRMALFLILYGDDNTDVIFEYEGGE